jgi:hypothetical protein
MNILYSSRNEHGANSNGTMSVLEEDSIYQTELAMAPFWYQTLALVVLSVLGIIGVLLNGFVIGCFAFCPIVSTPILVSAHKYLFIIFQPRYIHLIFTSSMLDIDTNPIQPNSHQSCIR